MSSPAVIEVDDNQELIPGQANRRSRHSDEDEVSMPPIKKSKTSSIMNGDDDEVGKFLMKTEVKCECDIINPPPTPPPVDQSGSVTPILPYSMCLTGCDAGQVSVMDSCGDSNVYAVPGRDIILGVNSEVFDISFVFLPRPSNGSDMNIFDIFTKDILTDSGWSSFSKTQPMMLFKTCGLTQIGYQTVDDNLCNIFVCCLIKFFRRYYHPDSDNSSFQDSLLDATDHDRVKLCKNFILEQFTWAHSMLLALNDRFGMEWSDEQISILNSILTPYDYSSDTKSLFAIPENVPISMDENYMIDGQMWKWDEGDIDNAMDSGSELVSLEILPRHYFDDAGHDVIIHGLNEDGSLKQLFIKQSTIVLHFSIIHRQTPSNDFSTIKIIAALKSKFGMSSQMGFDCSTTDSPRTFRVTTMTIRLSYGGSENLCISQQPIFQLLAIERDPSYPSYSGICPDYVQHKRNYYDKDGLFLTDDFANVAEKSLYDNQHDLTPESSLQDEVIELSSNIKRHHNLKKWMSTSLAPIVRMKNHLIFRPVNTVRLLTVDSELIADRPVIKGGVIDRGFTGTVKAFVLFPHEDEFSHKKLNSLLTDRENMTDDNVIDEIDDDDEDDGIIDEDEGDTLSQRSIEINSLLGRKNSRVRMTSFVYFNLSKSRVNAADRQLASSMNMRNDSFNIESVPRLYTNNVLQMLRNTMMCSCEPRRLLNL